MVPGWGGGANWGGAGYDPETGYIYISSRRQHITVGMQPVSDAQARGYDYEHKFYRPTVGGLQVVKPPYGAITAYDMNRGEIAWQTPPRQRAARAQAAQRPGPAAAGKPERGGRAGDALAVVCGRPRGSAERQRFVPQSLRQGKRRNALGSETARTAP